MGFVDGALVDFGLAVVGLGVGVCVGSAVTPGGAVPGASVVGGGSPGAPETGTLGVGTAEIEGSTEVPRGAVARLDGRAAPPLAPPLAPPRRVAMASQMTPPRTTTPSSAAGRRTDVRGPGAARGAALPPAEKASGSIVLGREAGPAAAAVAGAEAPGAVAGGWI